MFQFTRLPRLSYVFRQAYARITTRGFPHSDIPGSEVGQHLLRAFRSRPRPSSAPSAKASTVCPSSLDFNKKHRVCRYGVFKVRAAIKPQSGRPRAVSQNSAALETSWSTLFQASRTTGRPLHDPVLPSTGSAPTGVIAPASLERR